MKFPVKALLAGIALAVVCAGYATGQTLGKYISGTPVVFSDHLGSDAQVWFYDGSSHYAKFAVPSLAANYTLTLPVDDGTANQQLTTDGSGVLSWAAAATGAGTMSDFILDADTGTPQTVEDGETITITGGAGISTVVGATNEVTISSLWEEVTAPDTNDYISPSIAEAQVYLESDGSYGGASQTLWVVAEGGGQSAAVFESDSSLPTLALENLDTGNASHELAAPRIEADQHIDFADNPGISAPPSGKGRLYAGGVVQPSWIQPSGLDRQLQGLVYQAQAASSAITNTTSETAFNIGTFTFPADSLTDGMVIKGRCYIRAATTATPNLTLRVELDTITVIEIVFSALNLAAATDGYIEYEITVITTGASGTVWGCGSAAFNRNLPLVDGSGTAAVGSVDTTNTCVLEVTAQWSAPSMSNTITMYPPTTVTVSN